MRSLLVLIVLALAFVAVSEATSTRFWRTMATDKQWGSTQRAKIEKILQLLEWPQNERTEVLEQFSKLSPKDIDEVLVNFYQGLGTVKPGSLIESSNTSGDKASSELELPPL